MKCERCGCEIVDGQEWPECGGYVHNSAGWCIAALRSRVADLEKDAERLDWLSDTRGIVLTRDLWPHPPEVRKRGEVYTGEHVRAAIDAAMEES